MKPLNFLIMIPVFLLMIPVSLAEQICSDNSTLSNIIVTKQGNQPVQTTTINETCQFGCDVDNNRCNPSAFDTLIWYIGGVIIAVIVIILLIARLR
jgi:hypothetical protein